MLSRVLKNSVQFVWSRPKLAILIACHLPLVGRYFAELWPRQHYQFFPFAVIAFISLFATRKSQQPERWNWIAKSLIGLDVVCCALGSYLFSPWFFAVGLLCCMAAWCLASLDKGYDRSLYYLTLLPLTAVRLPLNYDEPVIMWLQRVTTSVASGILHQSGMVHYREGNTLLFPGKSFLVEEACSGVQSLFTILFLAALVFCLKRRSFLHGVCLVSVGLLLSGIMNILRVATIAIAWDVNSTDLSIGWQHDGLGYICLGLAAAMLMSADLLLEFLFGPMLDVRRHGGGSLYFNPLIAVWNRVFTVLPTEDPRFAVVKNPSLLDSRVTEAERREYAPFSTLLSPLLWFQFCFGGAESWLFSRSRSALLAGTPFLILAVTSAMMISWQRHSSTDAIVANYEEVFNDAVAAENLQRQETSLRALASLRPSDPAYRFRLAQFMLAHNKVAEGIREIVALAPESRPGYADAHLWMATQGIQSAPAIKLSDEIIEQHLKHALSLSSRNLQAHLMLAQIYAGRKEWKLAERVLTDAAGIDPEHYLALAKLRKQLKREPQDIAKATQLALDHFTTKLSADRSDVKTRIQLAETLVVAGQDAQAHELLVTGLQQNDVSQLRRALNDLELLYAERRLNSSGLNRDAVVPVVIQALQRDPSHLASVQMLAKLQALGATFPPAALQPAIEYWEQAVAKNPDSSGSRVLLGEILLAAGQDSRAIEVLTPAAEKQPELRLALAKLKSKNAPSVEATQLMETVIAEAKAKLSESPDDVAANSQLAQALLVAGRVSETKSVLARFVKSPEKDAIPEPPELAALYGQACILEFDQLTGYSGDPRSISLRQLTPEQAAEVDANRLLDLLDQAYSCSATVSQAIDRLSRLSLSNHPAATGADEMLRQLRLDGAHASTVLNLLGMHALMMNRFDKAKVWLEQANLQTRGRDPMILNNLATAIVRSGGDSNERALQLANETLTLLPDHPDALSTRGEVYVAMQRWPDAIADLTQSLQHRSQSAELHRLLEKAYQGINDAQMAADHGTRAEELEAATTRQ